MHWNTSSDKDGICHGTIKVTHNETELKITVTKKTKTEPGWVAIVTGKNLSIVSPLNLIRLENATNFESAIIEAKKFITEKLCSLIENVIELPSS